MGKRGSIGWRVDTIGGGAGGLIARVVGVTDVEEVSVEEFTSVAIVTSDTDEHGTEVGESDPGVFLTIGHGASKLFNGVVVEGVVIGGDTSGRDEITLSDEGFHLRAARVGGGEFIACKTREESVGDVAGTCMSSRVHEE